MAGCGRPPRSPSDNAADAGGVDEREEKEEHVQVGGTIGRIGIGIEFRL